MAKTDKELTTEIVCAFIESWNAKNGTQALNIGDVVDIIESVHQTIHALSKDE